MLCTHLGKSNKNKIILFHLTYSSSGSRVAGACLGSSGHRQDPTLDRMPWHHRVTHIHPHPHFSDGENVDTPITSSEHFWDVGETWISQRKPTDPGRCTNSIHSGPNWEFISSPHQHYNKMTSNEMVLFKDLLYIHR